MDELLIYILPEFTQTHTFAHSTSPFYANSLYLRDEKNFPNLHS